MRKINIPKDLLERLYTEERMSTYDISEELGVSRQTISNKLKEHGIKIREYKFKKTRKPMIKVVKQYKDKDKFEQAYRELKALDLVAKHFGISPDTAYIWRKKHDIPIIRENSKRSNEQTNKGKPYADRKYLSKMYDSYSTFELAKMWECHPTTIQKWLKRLDIPIKTPEEQWRRERKVKDSISIVDFNLQEFKERYQEDRELHSNWVSFIKDLVGECQSCGESEVLDLHHINENRRDNIPENHVILCPNCHAKIHRLGYTVIDLVPNYVSWDKLLDSYQEAK